MNRTRHFCCRQMRRQRIQTLFFCVITTCVTMMFVGESAIRTTANDDDVTVAASSSSVEFRAATGGEDTRPSFFKLVFGKFLELRQDNALRQRVSAVQANSVSLPLNANSHEVMLGKQSDIIISNAVEMNIEPPAFVRWRTSETRWCNGQLLAVDHGFAHLSHVVVDRNFCQAIAHGGEPVETVMNQDEKAEYYSVLPNCFQLNCDSDDVTLQTYTFNGHRNYLNDWLTSMKGNRSDLVNTAVDRVDETFTIAITRHDYANLYHTLTDWYNAFLVMKYFHKLPSETIILFIDAHPRGHLDEAWRRIFNRAYFLSELPVRTKFKELVWGIQGYNSLIKNNNFPDLPPFLDEFRSFFLTPFKVQGQTRTLNCSSISVTFLWRRDYVAHPRNPTGIVQRKIENEEEILQSVRRLHPEFKVNGVQIDAYEMRDQLQTIVDTDILIGMHGAGMAHVVFMPAHGAVIEMFPSYYNGLNRHIGDLAQWRGMTFLEWRNKDEFKERSGYRTRVPVDVVNFLLDTATARICRRSEPKPSQEVVRLL